MTMRVNGRWPCIFACALIALWTGGETACAAPVSSLGIEVLQAEPSGGYVGRLDVAPDHGPAGTVLTAVSYTHLTLPTNREV